jgi:opacity protein-like surface antigen
MNRISKIFPAVFGLLLYLTTVAGQTTAPEKLSEDSVENPPAVSEQSEKTPEFSIEKLSFGKRDDFVRRYKKFQTDEIRPPFEISRKKFSAKTFRDESETGYKHKRGEKHIGIEVGIAPVRPTYLAGESEYDRSQRKLAFVGLTWGRVIGTAKGVTYDYELKIIPLTVAFRNEIPNRDFVDPETTPNEPPTVRTTSYGFGISPLGFRFLFRPEKRTKPFFAAHAGVLVFTDRFPIDDARHLNFTGDFGGGIQYQLKPNRAIEFGYRYFHISNMNFGRRNPGYNANVFYIGYSFFYK